ncbi:thiopurine s-methyltransferase [Plakobranchus ocellatus]|uniref:Thiopurine s-methyltransferase n=1 Tax=Plakobranchus ocellatus TaxID=259542 RepID=A0AAV3YFK0_9GAST|nr:thiopurine s-methyltransferase [Plakobranchus ocellatus]
MASQYNPDDGAVYWEYRYDVGYTGWHHEGVRGILIKHFNLLNPDDKVYRVLVTMCGMSVDMDWLARQGLEVIGVDLALNALKKFMANSGHEWTESPAPKLGPNATLFTRKDGKIKLYCGDVLDFSPDLEGKFDAVYDCYGLHAIDRALTPKFAKMIKSILNPCGRLLLDAIAYDPKKLQDEDPDCSVHLVEKHFDIAWRGEEPFNCFLIVKK